MGRNSQIIHSNSNKVVYIQYRYVVTLLLECVGKMISAETMTKEQKIKGKITEGMLAMAALLILDGKITECFQISHHVKSTEFFRSSLKLIQNYYNLQLPNLNRCSEQCFNKQSKCSKQERINPSQNELKEVVKLYYTGCVKRKLEEVIDFKKWLLDQIKK